MSETKLRDWMEERLRLFDFWAQAQHHWREFTPLYPSGGDVQRVHTPIPIWWGCSESSHPYTHLVGMFREFTPLYPSGGDVQKIIENDMSRHLHHYFFSFPEVYFSHTVNVYTEKKCYF